MSFLALFLYYSLQNSFSRLRLYLKSLEETKTKNYAKKINYNFHAKKKGAMRSEFLTNI